MYGKGHRQGIFTPKNPEKYIGPNVKRIRYMSSYEYEFSKFLDGNPNILRWAYESIKIPYIKPTDGKVHFYYPDYWVEYKNKHDNIIREIIEVKPHSHTSAPKKQGKSKKTQLTEQLIYAINIAKWDACQQYCDKNNIKFRLLTEKQIFS